MSTDTTAELPVITSVEGRAGFIVLNRPRAINALTTDSSRGFSFMLKKTEQGPQ